MDDKKTVMVRAIEKRLIFNRRIASARCDCSFLCTFAALKYQKLFTMAVYPAFFPVAFPMRNLALGV
ncbi:MAG: hypothetical protein ACXWFI_03575 [Methylobacter sp.]